MSGELSEFYGAIRTSVTSGAFTPSVLWGAFAASLVAILEYNAAVATGGSVQVRVAVIVGGGVAGGLAAGSRATAAKAGALAAGLPVLVLGPVALVQVSMVGGIPSASFLLDTGSILLLTGILFVACLNMLFGAAVGYVTSWLVDRVSGRRANASEHLP